VGQERLDQLIAFLTDFADGVHHAKEEDVVLPLLSDLDPERAEWLSSALESDHKAGRKLVDTMRRNLEGAAAGVGHQAGAFASAARLYARHLRSHIELETEELFPSMRRLLGPNPTDVLVRFEEIERARLGATGRDLLERWLDDASGPESKG
jgi:hemerythrin-like domain-containing protein